MKIKNLINLRSTSFILLFVMLGMLGGCGGGRGPGGRPLGPTKGSINFNMSKISDGLHIVRLTLKLV